MMGQIAGLVSERKPLKDILEGIVNDAKKEKDELINKINSLN